MKVLDTKVLLKVKENNDAVTKIGTMEFRTEKEYETADVLAVGDKVIGVIPGETVLIYPGAGKTVKLENETYRVISSAEVIVVL